MTPARGPKPDTETKQARVPVNLRLLPDTNAALAKEARAAGIAKGEVVELALAAYLDQREGAATGDAKGKRKAKGGG